MIALILKLGHDEVKTFRKCNYSKKTGKELDGFGTGFL